MSTIEYTYVTSVRTDIPHFSEQIYKVVAADENAYVCKIVWPVPLNVCDTRLLLRSNYRFFPVGDDVIQALGLTEEEPTT